MSQRRRELRECVLLTTVTLLLSAACGSAQSDLFDRGSGGRAGANGGTSGSSGTNTGGSAQAGAGALGSGGESTGGAGADAGSGGTPDETPGGTAGVAGGGGSAGTATTAGRGGSAGSAGTAGRGGAGSGGTAGRGGNGGTAGRGGTTACEPETELCDGIDNDCDGGIDEAGACEGGCEGQVINGHAYMFCLVQSSTFMTAVTRCAAERMHLVWIESAAENAAILGAVVAADVAIDSAWIGAADRAEEGEWGWVLSLPDTGTSFWSGRSAVEGGAPVMGRYANWGSLRPNTGGTSTEDCATMTLDRFDLEPGTWNDDLCGDAFPFICER